MACAGLKFLPPSKSMVAQRFPRQRVTVVTCAYDDTERFALEQMLMNLFPKAGWDKPDWKRWERCPTSLTGGNDIYFVSTAGDSRDWAGVPPEQWVIAVGGKFNVSHDAGNTLCDVLYTLGILTTAWEERPISEAAGINNARFFFGYGASDGPAELAYKDPGRIFLLIGPNAPMFENRVKHPKKNTKSK